MNANEEVKEFNKQKIAISTLSGTTGGAMLGASILGIAGAVLGGIVGAAITGFSEYKSQHTDVSDNERRRP